MPQSPQVGAVEDGYRFKGGDPSDQSNWEQAQSTAQPSNGKPALSGNGSSAGLLDRDIPLTSYGNATLSGLQSVGRGLRSAGEGAAKLFAKPTGAAENTAAALGPIGLPAYRMMKGVGDTASQATQLPGAIRDINASPDPLYNYATATQNAAGEGAGQVLMGAATEGLVRGATPYVGREPLPPINVKGPGEIAPEMPRPRAYPQAAAPIPPRSGLALPGQVTDNSLMYNIDPLRAKLTSPEALATKMPDPYASADMLRSKLTAVPSISRSLGDTYTPPAVPASASGEALSSVANAGEHNALKNFISSNPSALGRVKPVGAPALTPSLGDAYTPSEGAPALPTERVSGGSAIAKVEAPKVKPVGAGPDAATRRSGYMFGEHASEYDPENLVHRKIKDMTHEQLATEANKRSMKGKSDWTADDFRRSTVSHGKSSNPNATFVRGQLLNEAGGESDVEMARRGGSEAPKRSISNMVPENERASSLIGKEEQEKFAQRFESRGAKKAEMEKGSPR